MSRMNPQTPRKQRDFELSEPVNPLPILLTSEEGIQTGNSLWWRSVEAVQCRPGRLSSICGARMNATAIHSSRPRATQSQRQKRPHSLLGNSALMTFGTRRVQKNIYGRKAKEHWERVAPIRYAEIPNPDHFFEELGEQVLTQVDLVATSLERKLSVDLPYLERVGQLNAIRKQAEEIVLSDLVWIQPELSEDEAREEWAATQPSVETLADWAYKMQDSETFGEPEPIQDVAVDWLLPEEFLEDLVVQKNPYQFLGESTAILKLATDRQFSRWQQSQDV